jgi:hypothetical protein
LAPNEGEGATFGFGGAGGFASAGDIGSPLRSASTRLHAYSRAVLNPKISGKVMSAIRMKTTAAKFVPIADTSRALIAQPT